MESEWKEPGLDMFEEENFIYNTQRTGCKPATKLSVYVRHLSRGELHFTFFFHSAYLPQGNQVNLR